MKIEALDHVNIRSPDVEATSRFFVDVLGMHATPAPGVSDMSQGAWICDAQERAIIHVASMDVRYPGDDLAKPATPSPPGAGRIHHVALRCSGYGEMQQRLRTQQISFIPNDVPQVGLRQIFIQDPNGVTLELNFFAD